MTCVICKGNKTVIKQGQEELCYNCDGVGEIKPKGS